MDKFVKLAVVLGIVLVGGGFFYHYVIYVPAIESCTAAAAQNYLSNWSASCQDLANGLENSLRACFSDPKIKALMDENYCKRTFGDGDPSPNCSLPRARADPINQAYRDEQEKCLAKAKLGL